MIEKRQHKLAIFSTQMVAFAGSIIYVTALFYAIYLCIKATGYSRRYFATEKTGCFFVQLIGGLY